MNLSTAEVVLAGGLLIAVITDLREERIYNALTFPLVALGFLVHGLAGDLWTPLLGAGVAFALHFLLFALNVERGGDAKLMIGVGALLGWEPMIESTLWMFLLLFPVGLTLLTLKGKLGNFLATLRFAYRRALGYPVEPPEERTMMPFAPVIAAGVLAARLTDVLVVWE